MISVLAFIHVVISIFLVILVLVQDPKGGAGSLFGGSGGSNSLFGATGAPSFLSKVTRVLAAMFAISCIAMTISIKPSETSLLDGVAAPQAPKAADPAPATSEPEAAQPTESAPADPTE